MTTDIRNRPDCYLEDGLPIYYSIYHEKDGVKLHMSFRIPKTKVKKGEPEYGKLLYEETHKLPPGTVDEPLYIREALQMFAPEFWGRFLHSDVSRRFLEHHLNLQEGLPLTIVWAADLDELTEQLGWHPKTLQRKEKILAVMKQHGWGTLPIGRLNAQYCGDTLLTDFSPSEHRAAVALLRQLANQEIGHKRLKENPWPKRSTPRRPASPKQSGTLVKQHIRPDCLTKEQVRQIMDDALPLFSVKREGKYALSLLLILAMGISSGEVCYIRLSAIQCSASGFPMTLHVAGTCRKSNSRIEAVDYPDDSPKNRVLPIPTKVAAAIKPLLEEWRALETESTYPTRYLIPHDKNRQRKANFKEVEAWINQRLRKQLEDKRMHDGHGDVIPTRSPYRRCLSTPRLSLQFAHFEPDEIRYFFGLSTNSVAGEYYCDFVNQGEQQRMRSLLDRWLGSPVASPLCDTLNWQNPRANSEANFGASGTIAEIVLIIHIPPVPEELLPDAGYEILFFARQGFSLDARSTAFASKP